MTYTVKSQSHEGEYAVTKVDGQWLCECPDNSYRQVKCKHIIAVELSTTIRAEVAVRRITPIENLSQCVYCGSQNMLKTENEGINQEQFRFSSAEIATNTSLSTSVLNI